MYVVVNTFFALPGKFSDLINVLQEASAFAKKVNGLEAVIFTPVSGKFSEVKISWQVENLSKHEEQTQNAFSQPEWALLSQKLVDLLVPNASRCDIYRQV